MTNPAASAILDLVPGAPIEDLGDGLLLRHARPEDADALAAFNANVHRNSPDDPPDDALGAWTRDLLLHPHPTFEPALFALVEDTTSGAIASTLNLIPQTWSYDGIPFGVGRIELVGTVDKYRRRGLVRRQMKEAHRWSAAMGHLMQAITGIPWYYRQFGYEMCVDLGGGRRFPADKVPALKNGEVEPFTFRPATEADIPFLMAVDADGQRRSLISCLRDADLWQYELRGRSDRSVEQRIITVIEDTAGSPVGFAKTGTRPWDTVLAIRALELRDGTSWLATMPSILRWAEEQGREQASLEAKSFTGIMFWLGADHPAYAALGRGATFPREPYAWYIRVPDVPAFLQRIRPTLERRLAASPATGHSGDLGLNFYTSGVQLRFVDGRLTEIVQKSEPAGGTVANFPGLSFLQVLTGWRSFDEVAYAFPDCNADDPARTLVDILFSKQRSAVRPIA